MAKAKKTEPALVAETFTVYQFKITLKDSKPAITRVIEVPSDLDFDAFHIAIQVAMGWKNAHVYMFDHRKSGYVVIMDQEFGGMSNNEHLAIETRIDSYFNTPKQEIRYVYDMGDGWEHTVRLDKIIPSLPDTFYPRCIKGTNACPPEDCGGVYGYYNMLETISNPDAEDYQEIREWMGLEEGDVYDTAYFDIEAVNAHYQEIFKVVKKKKRKTTKKAPVQAKPILVNISNLPADQWQDSQKKIALESYSKIVDKPLPFIDPAATTDQVTDIVDDFLEGVFDLQKKNQTIVAYITGVDPVCTHFMVSVLQGQEIECVQGTFRPVIGDVREGQTKTHYEFVQFRAYYNPLKGLGGNGIMGMLEQMMNGGNLMDILGK